MTDSGTIEKVIGMASGMAEPPRVSVIIPVYNRVKKLRRAIDSVVVQSYQPTEILVVDDASTEEYATEIKALEDHYDLVRVVRLPQNQGAAGARNAGMAACEGDYIAFLDSDDWWFPEKLERQLLAMLRSKSRFSTTAYMLIEQDRNPNGAAEMRTPNTVKGLGGMVWGCAISPGSTALFHRSIYEEVGPQDVEYPRLEDWDWMLRVCEREKVLVMGEPLTFLEVGGRPPYKAVSASIRRLLKHHTRKMFQRRLDFGLKFLSSSSIELAAAAQNNKDLPRCYLYGFLAFMLWPLRNIAFYRRVIRSFLKLPQAASSAVRALPPPSTEPSASPTVMHLISSLESGGAERMLTNLVVYDAQAAPSEKPMKHIVVALRAGGKYVETLRDQNIEVYFLNLRGILDVFPALLRLRQLIREKQPHILKCWMYHANMIGYLARKFMREDRKPVLLWGIRCSDMDLSRYSRTLRIVVWLGSLFSSRADGIVINNCSGIRHHRNIGFHNARWLLWDNGIQPERFSLDGTPSRTAVREQFGLSPDDFVIGTLARNDVMKGYDVLFRAIKNKPHIKCIAAGFGTETLVGPNNFLGLGDTRNVVSLLNAIDVFVLPSRFGEGFSNALVEAMAMGCAVIATDVGDNARIVGSAGLIVPPDDPAALGQAIAELAGNPEIAATLGANARDRIMENYTVEATSSSFKKLVADFS